jgi:predicted permease
MVINSLIPVFTLILAGGLLRKFKLIGARFTETADRLVYFVFFPALLFLKIGQQQEFSQALWPLWGATVCALAVMFGFSILAARLLHLERRSIGAFSQCCYRANTYVGMAVVIAAMGEQMAGPFGIYLGLMIPVINVLAVITMVWYSEMTLPAGKRLAWTVRSLVANPLILASLAGLGYAGLFSGFPVTIENLLTLTAAASLPLALISIGSAISLSALKGRLQATLTAAGIKVFVFPLLGYGFMRLWTVTGVELQMGMLFFALSVAPSTYVLVSQLHGDAALAAAVIAFSTLVSFFSLSLVMWVFF